MNTMHQSRTRTTPSPTASPSHSRSGLRRWSTSHLFGVLLCTLLGACSDTEPATGKAASAAMTTAGTGGSAGSSDSATAGTGTQAPPKPNDPAAAPSTPQPQPSAPKPAPAPAATPIPANDPAAQCEACLDANCQTEWNACEKDATCAALVDCIGACGPNDATCVQACATQHAAGRAGLEAFISCGDTMCPPCSEGDTPTDPDDPDGCTPTNPRPWSGGPIFTQAEVQACLDKCDDNACVAEQCAKGEQFLECIGVAGTQCAAAPTGPCRAEYEAFFCCIDACEMSATDMATFDACIDRDCPTQRDTWSQCLSDDQTCGPALRAACISASP